MPEPRPPSARVFWHPIVPALLLTYLVYRVSTSGITLLPTIGLVTVGAWFILSLREWLRSRHDT